MEQKQTSQQLIDGLVRDLAPVRRIRRWWLAALWLILAILIGGWFVVSVGVRPDLATRYAEFGYALSSWLFAIATLVSGFLCFRSGIPGSLSMRQNRKARRLLIACGTLALVAYGGLYGSIPGFSRSFILHDAIGCCMRITKGLAIPSIILLALTSKLAPTRAWTTTWYAVGAGTFLTSLVSQLNCPIDNPWHIMVGHGAMVVLTSGVVLWVLGLGMSLWGRYSANLRKS